MADKFDPANPYDIRTAISRIVVILARNIQISQLQQLQYLSNSMGDEVESRKAGQSIKESLETAIAELNELNKWNSIGE